MGPARERTLLRGGGLLKLTDAATGTSHFPAYDGNGNLTALVDSTTGALTATYDYDPFGNLLQLFSLTQ